MSSASSTARWMDWTVDSMLTTTPFFKPRDGCEPKPSTSIEPSAPISPTSATTFEVPMSNPTIKLRSDRLGILASIVPGAVRTRASPADGEAVAVAHVDIGDVIRALRNELDGRDHEALEALIHLATAEAHGDAVGEIELPCAALIEPDRR